MDIKFCGAAQTVTGSCHLITLSNGYKILLDCGLFQGRKVEPLNEKWFFKPKDIDCLILSHAHIDHSGRIPKLVKDGFKGPIYSTHATRSLCAIMLLDSAKIQVRDAEYHNKWVSKKKRRKKGKKKFTFKDPLYREEDVHVTMTRFIAMSYDTWFKINDDVHLYYKDAGHILGSASVTLRIRENGKWKTFGFTGDVGRPNRPILRDPNPMEDIDYLICESTYGDRLHEMAPKESKLFLDIIKKTCLKNKGKLIIPAFSVGRTQEIVYMLDQMENAGLLPRIPVYVDSPLAVNATTVFGSHPECFDNELSEYMLVNEDPFGFNQLTYIRDVRESKRLNTLPEPCIIISAAGMMNAGRSKHHLNNNIENPKNTILVVGYCSPETPGGKLRKGAETLKLFGEVKFVRANIEIMDSFSAHADKDELTTFIKPLKKQLSKLFLVHGDIDAQKPFKAHLLKKGYNSVEIPSIGQRYTLDFTK